MRLKVMSIVLMMFILQGCGNKSVCPKYPEPSQEVLSKIQSLESDPVNNWMMKQYKLNLKIKACNED